MGPKRRKRGARELCHEGARGETSMKPPFKKLADLQATSKVVGTYAAPTPKVSRQKKAKVLTYAERQAFIASRPDLKPKG
jgi:hypothetical protein